MTVSVPCPRLWRVAQCQWAGGTPCRRALRGVARGTRHNGAIEHGAASSGGAARENIGRGLAELWPGEGARTPHAAASLL